MNKENYKTYKKLFELIERKSKKNYFSKQILQHKNNMKSTWSVMKKIIGKMHQHNKSKLFVNKKYITLEIKIAKTFNEFFTEIGPSLARKIPAPSKLFESFLKKASTILPERCLTINEIKGAFFP